MDAFMDQLKLDPAQTCQEIELFIHKKLDDMARSGILVGLSGGLDSAVTAYLCVRGVGKKKVTALYMPDRDSKDIHRAHAERIASELDIPLEKIDLTPTLNTIGIYDLLPLRYLPTQGLRTFLVKFGKKLIGSNEGTDLLQKRLHSEPNSWVSKGNAYATIKHRVRMVQLYYQADIRNLMVVGAANKTELLTGTFSKWGCDHCADVMPIIHLYRSQLASIAEHLEIPEEIRSKHADPDVLPGVNNKEELLGSFLVTDQVLWGLENRLPHEEMLLHFGEENTNKIIALWESSKHMRESPYRLGQS